MNEPTPHDPRPGGQSPSADAEHTAEELAEHYLDQLQGGEAPDRAALLTAHPEIADALERQLALVEMMHHAARGSTDVENEPSQATEPRPLGSGHEYPEQIGRYVILETLGQGASGTVYRAYDPKFDRDVALKVLRSDRPLGPDFFKRFEREARIAAQLRHPYIVPIHETGEHAGQPYIDMELIDGETLDDRLKRDPLAPREAAELVQKLAEALDYAHRQGIIHRDMKPSNIFLSSAVRSTSSVAKDSNDPGRYGLLTTDYGPQLADFGLARRCGAEESLTGQGQILGTVAYMSPEQARGGAHEVDGRSDVYSLGVVLYRLLTGRVPFPTEESFTTQLYHIVHTEPAKPRSLNPNLPRDLETICLKALAKEPADRFATAAAIADELRRWLNDEPLQIRPPTWWERMRRWARRNRVAARITVAAALLLLLAGGTLGAMAWTQHKQRYEAEIREILEAQTRAEVQYRALLERARNRLRLPTPGRRFDTQKLLEAVVEPRKLMVPGETRDRLDLEARSLYAATLGVPDLAHVEQTDLPPDTWMRPWQVALHPDGKALVIGTHLRPLRWVRGQTLKLPENLKKNQPRPRLAFSPDGNYLAFAPANGGLELWDEEVTRTLAEWKPPDKRPVLDVSFRRDGKTLWACCDDGQVQVLSLPELKPGAHWQVAGKPSRLTGARFNLDATLLAVGDEPGHVLVYESNGKLRRELPSAQAAVQALDWSPDRRLVAVGTKDGTIQLWYADDGIPFHRLTLGANGVHSIRFTPDGRWVTAGHGSGPAKIWNVMTGEQVLTIALHAPWGFTRDGQRFAGGSSRGVAFYDLASPQTLRPFSGHQAAVARLAWCRDNRHLVTLDSRFEVRVWDVARAVAIDTFQPLVGVHHAMNAAVAISDDAGSVAYAGGGPQTARAVLRDAKKHTTLGDWHLPGGFEKLVYADGSYLPTVEAYNPSTNTWSTVASMPTARDATAAAVGSSRRIDAIGGSNGVSSLNTVEAYDPSINSWSTVAPMHTARHGLAAAADSDGCIYAIGGSDGVKVLNTVEGCTVIPMSTARVFLAAAAGSDGRIYAIGGANGSGYLNTVEAFATLTATGTTLSATAGQRFAAVVASFTDCGSNPGDPPDYRAVIDWGDATRHSTGGISDNGGGNYDGAASHTYADPGTYTATITITDNRNPTRQATATSTIEVTSPSSPSHGSKPACVSRSGRRAAAGCGRAYQQPSAGCGQTSDPRATVAQSCS